MFSNSHPHKFQSGLDPLKARRARQDDTLKLRRKQREQTLVKKARLLTIQSFNKHQNKANISNKLNDDYKYEQPMSTVTFQECMSNTKKANALSSELSYLVSIRNTVSTTDNKPKLELISSDIIPKIIRFMYCEDIQLVYEAVWIITNIAASTNKCTEYIVRHNAIVGLVHVIECNNFDSDIDIITQCIWALSNIAIDNKEFGSMIIETNILNKIINLILSLNISHKPNIKLYNQTIWLINCVLKIQNVNYLNMKNFQKWFGNLLQLICKTLSQLDDELVISYSLWNLNYITQGMDHALIEYIVNWNDKYFIQFCMKLLANGIDKYDITSKNNPIDTCINFIDNILSCNETTQCVLNYGYLKYIEIFVKCDISSIRWTVLFSLSKICMGNTKQTDYILSNDILMKALINCAMNDIKSIRIEAVICICNLIFGASLKQTQILVKFDIIKILCDALKPNNRLKEETIIKIIHGLENLLTTFNNNKMDIQPFISMFDEYNALKYLNQMFFHNDKMFFHNDKTDDTLNEISRFLEICENENDSVTH